MKTFWVIENTGEFRRIPGQVNYAQIHDVDDPSKQGFMDWTANIDDAVQFARKVDGERFANVYFWGDRTNIEVREHQYLAALDSTPPEPPAPCPVCWRCAVPVLGDGDLCSRCVNDLEVELLLKQFEFRLGVFGDIGDELLEDVQAIRAKAAEGCGK